MALEVDGRPLKGEFLHTARVVNTMVDQLNSFASEVTRVAREVGTDGRLGGQADVKGVAGTWKDLTESVNSRVEADGVNRSFTATSCDAALEDALANLQARIEESDVTIQRDPLPVVHGDSIQLGRVFLNLLINSIKYRHPDRPPHIHVSAIPQGSVWVVSVKDNGMGIEPEYREKVFGIFKRLHGRDNPGTGMGLAICRKIVTRHGGNIWVESAPGDGSTFFFTLRAAEA
jgi:light-regulated signal transduction histidine kinase (bacteriophytochrome)